MTERGILSRVCAVLSGMSIILDECVCQSKYR